MPSGRWIVAILALFGAGCSTCSGVEPARLPSAAEMQEVERVAHVQFPTSTHVLAWETERGIDSYLCLKFAVDASDWPSFLASTPIRPPDMSNSDRGVLGINHGRWDPQSPAVLPASQFKFPDASVLNVGVDRHDPKTFVVYLVYFTT